MRNIIKSLENHVLSVSISRYPNNSEYDVIESLLKLLRQSVPEFIKLIKDDADDFGSRIQRQLLTFCENFYMILVKCIGHSNAEKCLDTIAINALAYQLGE